MKDEFNSSLADSQATAVTPLTPEQFDTEAYADYAAGLDARCKAFWKLLRAYWSTAACA